MRTRSPMMFIFFTVLIDLLGIGIVIPVLPYYVKILESSGDAWLMANRARPFKSRTSSIQTPVALMTSRAPHTLDNSVAYA